MNPFIIDYSSSLHSSSIDFLETHSLNSATGTKIFLSLILIAGKSGVLAKARAVALLTLRISESSSIV